MPRISKSLKARRNSLMLANASKEKLKAAPRSQPDPPAKQISGRRIVSCQSIEQCLKNVASHSKSCKKVSINFAKENSKGLASELIYSCRCGWKVKVKSDFGNEQYPINEAMSWGCNNAAIGFTDACTLLTCLEAQTPTWHTFKKQQDELYKQINTAAETCMAEANAEERRLAIEAGDFVEIEGRNIPAIRVVTDGGWPIRSYGHGYTSNYGHGVIIGAKTKKVLYVGTKQKYCYICSLAENDKKPAKPHVCAKDWNMASTAMEAAIIKAGFQESITKHDLVYSSFIGDGDSSVHASVKDIYPGLEVMKIECSNHVMKNINAKLAILSGPSGRTKWKVTQDERRIPGMKERFSQIGRVLKIMCEHYNKLGDYDINAPKLRSAILNIPNHVFGCHKDCEDFYCEKLGVTEKFYAIFKTKNLYRGVKELLLRPANLARSLIECETSNIAESFMSVVAKQVEGKRKNLGGMWLYKMKVKSAALSFNTESFYVGQALKLLKNQSPCKKWKHFEIKARKRRAASRASQPRVVKKPKWNFLRSRKGDDDYGDSPNKPLMNEADLQEAVTDLRNSLQVDLEQRSQIEKDTRHQAESEEWFNQRKHRLTASNAGKICSLQDSTNNTATLKTFLGKSSLYGKALQNCQYGKDHEDDAISAYEKLRPESGKVRKCGLFISMKNGVLAASPDGLIGEDGLLEVKTAPSIKDHDPNDWPDIAKCASSCPLEKKDGVVRLKRSHKYFYQIVQQIALTGVIYGDFVIWTEKGTFIERISKEEADTKWKDMEPKLLRFWNEDMAPEVVDSRLKRNPTQECRQPAYRLKAMEEKKATSAKTNVKQAKAGKSKPRGTEKLQEIGVEFVQEEYEENIFSQ